MPNNFSTKRQIDSFLKGLDRETPYYFEPDSFEDHVKSSGSLPIKHGSTGKGNPEGRFAIKRKLYFNTLKKDLRCKLCEKVFTKTKDLVVDHCHSSNKIRGVLCQNCNHGLGKFFDDPKLMRKAAEWVENFKPEEALDYYTLKGPQEALGSPLVSLNEKDRDV